MILKNNREERCFNGDIGTAHVEPMEGGSAFIHIPLSANRQPKFFSAKIGSTLALAYALTVHKSQGSEFPAVILPVAQVPPRLCYRNLFYTGVTRARKLCVVAGRRDVVNSMMSNIRQNLRYSGLCALLQAGQPPEQLSTEGEEPR